MGGTDEGMNLHMNDAVYINPWAELVMQNATWQRKHDFDFHYDAKGLNKTLRALRKDYMGSGCSLEKLVRDGDQPEEAATELLSSYLSERTAYFLRDPKLQTYLYDFFYFTIQLYAHGQVGEECLDDLIQMAEAHERDIMTLPIICSKLLPENLACDCELWVAENDFVPTGMSECVTAAVGVLLGVVEDPFAAAPD